MKLYMFQTVPPSIIRSLFTVHSAVVYVIQVCRQLSSRSICSCWKAVTNLYDIYNCCVYSEQIPDDGRRNCPKHVRVSRQNKFVKSVHLVGFIINETAVTVLHLVWLHLVCILLSLHYGTPSSEHNGVTSEGMGSYVTSACAMLVSYRMKHEVC